MDVPSLNFLPNILPTPAVPVASGAGAEQSGKPTAATPMKPAAPKGAGTLVDMTV